MSDWRKSKRLCHCGNSFQPQREGQRHCSASCRDRAKKQRKRRGNKPFTPSRVARSGDTPVSNSSAALGDGPTMVWPEKVPAPDPITEVSWLLWLRSNTKTVIRGCRRVWIGDGSLDH